MSTSLNSISRRCALASVLVVLASPVAAQQVLRVTAIPDESPTELARKAAPLVRYLESRLSMKVEFTPVTDYAAAVETLVNRKVDLAWFGGFTFVQASVRSGGKVIPLVQREEDERFRSVFITSDPAIKSLADLKGRDVSFGSQSSTSGHLMPRSFLLQAGIDPDKDFRRVAYSGAHDATIAAVAAGRSWSPRRRSTPTSCASSTPRRPTTTTTGACTPTCPRHCARRSPTPSSH